MTAARDGSAIDQPPSPAAIVRHRRPRTRASRSRGLSKSYGGIRALDRHGPRGPAGTIHAVVGENGAGKSTLMKILAGAVAAGRRHDPLDGQDGRLRLAAGCPACTASASSTRS